MSNVVPSEERLHIFYSELNYFLKGIYGSRRLMNGQEGTFYLVGSGEMSASDEKSLSLGMGEESTALRR